MIRFNTEYSGFFPNFYLNLYNKNGYKSGYQSFILILLPNAHTIPI